MVENITVEYKSLKKVNSGDSGFKDLATTCVCMANTQGGRLIIGIEDKDKCPPIDQVIEDVIVNITLSRLRSLSFNVGISSKGISTHDNGGQYFTLEVYPSLKSIATTSDGKIYVRVGDQCQAARSEDIHRIASEKDAFQWELQTRPVYFDDLPRENIKWFANQIRHSERVKNNVKELEDIEIAEHYNLLIHNQATNLGVLWLGNASQRSRLSYPVTFQYIVYDEFENKIRKISWHDNVLNLKELILDIEKQAIELTYFDEFPQGLFRKQIRHYDERVIRELLINAIAHKSYTISGDIFIKVFSDRLEITNPGGLPLGITSDNILHTTNRRNPNIIRVLHDLGLMEGEGTGYNLIYEIDSRDSKPYPVPISSYDTITVTQSSKILNEDALLLIDFISKNYNLLQKELIVLGIVARNEKILATQLSKELQISEEDRLRSYVGKLIEQGILIARGIKKGTEYLINPKLIVSSKINIKPTLKIIEIPRLKALIEELLRLGPNLTLREIHTKLGDVSIDDVRKTVYSLVKEKVLDHTEDKTYRKYWLA